MSETTSLVRKLTVSLPTRLADFLDREASRLNVSRSKLVADAVREIQAAEEERLAIEGYRFYPARQATLRRPASAPQRMCSKMPVRRGEIYWVEFDPVKGSEQRGLRPALIVQNDPGNRYSPTTVVVAITRTVPPEPYPFVVVVEAGESGLSERSAVNCSQIATIQQAGSESQLRPPRGESEVRPIGSLNTARMAQVDEALRTSLSLR